MNPTLDSMICVEAAMAEDLPDIEHRVSSGAAASVLRPRLDGIEVYSFPQVVMVDTASPSPGRVGAKEPGKVQVTVVIDRDVNAAVYFGRRIAYVVQGVREPFRRDLQRMQMSERRQQEYAGEFAA